MEEIILQTLIKMRTDYGNNEMIIFAQDSDLKVVADEIKTAINYTHCCESDSELLKGKHPITFAKWRENEGYTPYDNTSYQKDNKIFNVEKLEIKYRAYYKTF